MIIENTNYGKLVKVWNDGYSDDWSYQIRNVKVLNGWLDEQHPIIEKLAKREAKLERKLLLLLNSMENFFLACYKYEQETGKYDYFAKWEEKHKVDFNRHYHDQIHDLIEEIDGISREYCYYASRDGYCYAI